MSELTDWNKFTIPQLKEHLKKRSLDQSGKKADLVNRLIASDLALKEDAANDETAPENEETQPKEEKELETENTEQKETSESQNVEAMDAAVNPIEDSVDFTENITFEELEQNVQSTEGTASQPAMEQNTETGTAKLEETIETGEGDLPAAETKKDVEEEGKDEQKEEEPDISNQFSIDMPKDKDWFWLTWNGKKFMVPFKTEINSELISSYVDRSLLVSPVELSDLGTDLFKQLLERALKFSMNFFDRSHGKTTTGQVRFLFKSPEEVEDVKAELKAFRETLVVEHVKFEFSESEDDFLPIVKKEQPKNTGSVVQRLLFVGNLPSDVTEATLSQLFPDALRVILPHKEIEGNAENLEQTRHAYVEYSSEEEAAANIHKEMALNNEKLFIIKAMTVKKEKFGLLSDSLRQIFLDKVRKLQRIQKNPYNKSQHDLNEIEKAIIQTKEKLALDTEHRKGWGMLLGKLDESVLEKEEEPNKIGSVNQRGRGGNQRSRGGRGQIRGNFRGGQASRRGGQIGGTMTGIGGNQRGGYGFGGAPSTGYGRGGWNAGYGGSGYQSYYGGGSAYPTQSYGGGYNQFSGKRRASYDNYGGEWKRGRGSYQPY